MGKKLIAFGVVGLLAAGAAGAGYWWWNSPLERAKRDVSAVMRDPGSTMFRDLAVKEKGVCGQVNARNGYGAYAGFELFAYEFESRRVMISPDSTSPPEPMDKSDVKALTEWRNEIKSRLDLLKEILAICEVGDA